MWDLSTYNIKAKVLSIFKFPWTINNVFAFEERFCKVKVFPILKIHEFHISIDQEFIGKHIFFVFDISNQYYVRTMIACSVKNVSCCIMLNLFVHFQSFCPYKTFFRMRIVIWKLFSSDQYLLKIQRPDLWIITIG